MKQTFYWSSPFLYCISRTLTSFTELHELGGLLEEVAALEVVATASIAGGLGWVVLRWFGW